VRLTPIFERDDYVEEFLPDETLTDDDTHKSKMRVPTTEIAFLKEKDVGLMDVARKNQTKCLLFLRFLAGYMIREDCSWNEELSVECECGNTHGCLKQVGSFHSSRRRKSGFMWAGTTRTTSPSIH
jgi:hypothetical protein